VSVYTDLLVVSPAGEKKVLPVIALVALENFLQKLIRNPGFKMDWTHCALDHNAAVCEGLSLTRDVFKQMPLQEPTSYQATAIPSPTMLFPCEAMIEEQKGGTGSALCSRRRTIQLHQM
jgi:hypothetical protein